ncbi:bifunctional 4-hydroxy-2-oxoglutarate aldolase/2-dehydro-3-deoxy-phosphogluconate aldolase [Salinisphaera sp. T31B1]|uniref:bifunctional 4-hydroxy-2-oxoglutarate aldolase/2-dehydro-3-deoxy-phosphogluconate aldolase n=1 Tax=Salinisphaera sp. T31B1 TaxID=727963 RepID=UPI0033411320
MKRHQVREVMAISPVIPVVVTPTAEAGVEIARALLAGGIGVIEVTLRTAAGLDAIRAIGEHVPDICVGAGTVWTAAEAQNASDAGAAFIVSPGISDAVGDRCAELDLAYLPGAQTVSEIAHHRRRGLDAVKLFPASVVGGPKAIKAYASVFPDLQFCPTGGVSSDNAPDYLALDCIPCVGGSWLVDKTAVAEGNWQAITDQASAAAKLG